MKPTPNKILIIGIVFYIVQNCYFGWNEKPESLAELVCDYIVAFFCLWFFLGEMHRLIWGKI